MHTPNPTADDELYLVQAAQKQDLSAFEMLYRMHLNKVYSLCYRLVADVSQAEELTQEAFVRLWQKIHLFNGQSAFSTWMYRLVTNVVLSELRKRRPLIIDVDPQTIIDNQVYSQSKHGVARDLEKAILMLPEGARQIFVLHDVEGHKHSDIAEQLGIAIGTSKTQLHRARKLLRELV